MVMLNLTVFEREKLRVASDEMVARLRRLARDASRPKPSADWLDFRGAHASDTGGVSTLPAVADESAVGAQGMAKGGSLNLLSGRDETGTLLITEAEAGALEELNKTQKGFCEREGTRLTLAMHCGLILLPGSGGRRGRGSRAGIGRGDARAGGGQSHGGSEGATLEVLPKIWGRSNAKAPMRRACATRAARMRARHSPVRGAPCCACCKLGASWQSPQSTRRRRTLTGRRCSSSSSEAFCVRRCASPRLAC